MGAKKDTMQTAFIIETGDAVPREGESTNDLLWCLWRNDIFYPILQTKQNKTTVTIEQHSAEKQMSAQMFPYSRKLSALPGVPKWFAIEIC